MYGKDIKNKHKPLSENDITKDFNCGNEIINNYLHSKALTDKKAKTFIVINTENNEVICYYSLCCSGFVTSSKNKFTIYPAVEIKMFAIDEKYQHMKYSDDVYEDNLNLSDMLFAEVISFIYDFTDNFCGADEVILYSVPDAENFYLRNGFKRFENFMLESSELFTDGCIPMYMNL